MQLPSKVTPFRESILSKLPVLAKTMRERDMSLAELYSAVRDDLDGPADFVDALDCLYALGMIDLDEQSRELHYAG